MRKRGFMTIGYGNIGVREFIDKVKALRINCIVDIRTRPYSKYNISFNKEELRDRLSDQGISYFWFGNKLGGRYDKIKYCDEFGRVDYEKVAKSEKFIEGIEELKKLIPKYNICIMCSEKDPLKCHRFLLIARLLKEYNIYHIMPDFTLTKNDDLEESLLNMYGNADQISLFDDMAESLEKLAYRKQGLKTSYVSQKVKDLLLQGATDDLPEKTKIYCIGCEEKTAQEFFELLKNHKVKRVVDVREHTEISKTSFAKYPDIEYYLKLNCISYERLKELIPTSQCVTVKKHDSIARYLRKYSENITKNNALDSLIADDLEGTCFLGSEKDYKKCHRHIITNELKRKNPNIIVRHLR